MSPVPIRFPRDRMTPAAIAAVAIVAMLVYANSIVNGFVLDDRFVVNDNPLVHQLSGIWRAWIMPYWPPQHPAGQYRPLTIVSFTIDWVLSGGDPRWFHAMNVMWHAAASVLVWALLRRMLSPAGALAGALLFAVHPVHVEAVSNVVGRAELMAATFALATLVAHSRRHWSAIPLFLLALASKESAIVTLGLAVAWDLVIERDPRVAFRDRRWLYAGYLVGVAALAVALAAVFAGRRFVDVAVLWINADTGVRLLTMLGVVVHYVRLMIAPTSLSADYNPRVINLEHSLSLPVIAGAVILFAWGLGVAIAWRRSRPAAYGLLWFAIAVSPVSNVLFASGIVLAERTLYLPSVAIALLGGLALERLAPRRTSLTLAVATVVVLLFAARTWTRTPVWRSNRVLILTTADEVPQSYKIHHRMAGILMNLRDTVSANKEYALATHLFPGDPYLYREVAEAALQQRDPRRALAALDTAIQLMPDHASPHLRRGDAHFMLGNWSGAIESARRAYALAPDSIRALVIVATAHRASGDPAAALATYRDAVRSHPNAWLLHAGLAGLLLEQGDVAGARAEADQAMNLSRGSPEAREIEARVTAAEVALDTVTGSGIVQDTVQKTAPGATLPRR